MKMLSREPDEDMKWIYAYTRPEYPSDQAKDLRNRRDSALRHAPQWMIEEARMNDILRTTTLGHNAQLTGAARPLCTASELKR